MDDQGGDKPATSRIAGPRASNQLVVEYDGRKPLFTSDRNTHVALTSATAAGSKTAPGVVSGLSRGTKFDSRVSFPLRREVLGIGRRGSSGNEIGGETSAFRASPAAKRIPRPHSAQPHQQQIKSIKDAFYYALEMDMQEPEAGHATQPVDGSPSPAPRQWRARSNHNENRRLEMAVSKARGRQPADEAGSGGSDSSSNNELRRSPSKPEHVAPAWEKPLDWPSPERSSRHVNHVGIPDLVPGIEDIPLPSVDPARQEKSAPSPGRRIAFSSPDRSFAWQVEDDFTAGDVQVSDSPRIRVGNKQPLVHRPSLLGRDATKPTYTSPTRLTQPGFRNTKLDEIRARELGLEKHADKVMALFDGNRLRPKNTKLDDIWQREADGLSARAYSVARLAEIQEQNSMSRSKSPEETKPRSSPSGQPQPRSTTPGSLGEAKAPPGSKPAHASGGERIPDTPITVYKTQRRTEGSLGGLDSDDKLSEKGSGEKPNGDSHDLLRRLARAASASPAPEAETTNNRLPISPCRESNGNDTDQYKSRLPKPSLIVPLEQGRKKALTFTSSRHAEPFKPVVGFKGPRQMGSADSPKNKRSSVLPDEIDPTDGIEAEKRLFAPHENHSERGSVGAPSPLSDSNSDSGKASKKPMEATPRLQKQGRARNDLASLPTPRVTGAFVETPLTVKIEKLKDEAGAETREPDKQTAADFCAPLDKEQAAHGDNEPGTVPDLETSSWNRNCEAAPVVTSTMTKRRRRRPPLRNSAKPPSVRDDLIELHGKHNIEDSTTDDMDEVLTHNRHVKQASDSDEPAAISHTKMGSEAEMVKGDNEDAEGSETDDAFLERMDKKLYSGLCSIVTAKHGIERLQGQVSPVARMAAMTTAAADEDEDNDRRAPVKDMADDVASEKGDGGRCADCHARRSPEAAMSMQLPVLRLYETRPRFRLTLAGLALLALSLWLAVETAVCAHFCRPTVCVPGADCVYSLDDPRRFGLALPVKLDHWVAGGRASALVSHKADAALDWLADLQDSVLGRSAADVSTTGMTYAQRRRHRRRLAKKGLLSHHRQTMAAAAAAVAAGGVAGEDRAPNDQLRARWESWRRTREVRERAQEARRKGYLSDAEDGGGASIGNDERVG